MTLPKMIEAQTKAALLDALEKAGGNVSAAAKVLGISRSAVHRLIRRFGLKREGGFVE